MTQTRAAVVRAFGEPLEMRSVPVPELEGGALLLRIDAATLCGTDVHFWHGAVPPESLPYIPGHETTGSIAQMSSPREDILGAPLAVGDRVIAAYAFCGHCFYCTVSRQPTLCRQSVRFGRNSAERFPYLLGGCAEFHYIPPTCDIIRVPDEVPAPLAASAACALRTVMHGFERLGPVASHETILVQGAGPVGLYAAAVARDRGAQQVLVIGAPANRLEVASAWGADDTLNLDEATDPAERLKWVRARTGGRGADVVIQCATLAAIPEGLEIVRPGGRYVSIGGGGREFTVPSAAWGKFLDVRTVVAAEGRHFYQALQFLATRTDIPFERLITGTYPLERVTDALQAMADFREVKPVILPRN